MVPTLDPYLYPGTTVLINKFDIRDQKELDEIEAAYISLRLSEIAENPLSGKYDRQHLQAMHKYILGDLYEWAGEYRTIDIEKAEAVLGGLSVEYSPHGNIDDSFKGIMMEMKAVQWPQLSQREQAQRFTDCFSRLWQIHPFREGNTRTITHFCCQYADSVKMPVDRQLFQKHSQYLRNALVASRAIFQDLGDRSQPVHLYRIVLDAINRGENKRSK